MPAPAGWSSNRRSPGHRGASPPDRRAHRRPAAPQCLAGARSRAVRSPATQLTSGAGAADTVTYAYDAADHQIGQDDGQGRTWTSSYDLLGRRTSQTDPDTGSSSSTYDNAGQLLTTTDARNKTISYQYDEMGRKKAEYDTTANVAPAAGNELAAWTYDTLKKGKPTSSTRYVGGTSGTAYTQKVAGYDSHGWPQATQLVIPAAEGALAGTYTTQNSYNLTGTLSSYTDAVPATVKLPQETCGSGRMETSSQGFGQAPFTHTLQGHQLPVQPRRDRSGR
ncbi:RHS repeat domain-containing protein [Streptomyces sp. NPDC057927]